MFLESSADIVLGKPLWYISSRRVDFAEKRRAVGKVNTMFPETIRKVVGNRDESIAII